MDDGESAIRARPTSCRRKLSSRWNCLAIDGDSASTESQKMTLGLIAIWDRLSPGRNSAFVFPGGLAQLQRWSKLVSNYPIGIRSDSPHYEFDPLRVTFMLAIGLDINASLNPSGVARSHNHLALTADSYRVPRQAEYKPPRGGVVAAASESQKYSSRARPCSGTWLRIPRGRR